MATCANSTPRCGLGNHDNVHLRSIMLPIMRLPKHLDVYQPEQRHAAQLPADKQRAIADELDRTVGEVIKKLEDIRNK